jgi:hypothetical protein
MLFAKVTRVVIFVKMGEEGCLVIIPDGTEIAARMSLTTIPIATSQMSFILALRVELLFGWEHLFVVNTKIAHQQLVLSLTMSFQRFDIPFHRTTFCHLALEAP